MLWTDGIARLRLEVRLVPEGGRKTRLKGDESDTRGPQFGRFLLEQEAGLRTLTTYMATLLSQLKSHLHREPRGLRSVSSRWDKKLDLRLYTYIAGLLTSLTRTYIKDLTSRHLPGTGSCPLFTGLNGRWW